MKEGNNYREYGGCSSCYFHPKEVVLGVCHLCLNDRLVVLAAKQGLKSNPSKLGFKPDYICKTSNNNSFNHTIYHHNNPKSYVSLPNFFGIVSFFNSRDKFRRHRHRCRRRESDHDFPDAVHRNDDDDATSTSIEDESFISIKFGDNGVASWDKGGSNVSKVSLERCSLSWGGQTASSVKDGTLKGTNYTHNTVVEHAKRRPPLLRWRKRIGQLFKVMRWKKSTKANAGGGGGVGIGDNKVVRNNKSWTRTLNIRTKE